MFFNKNVYFICLRIYRPTYIVGLQATGEQMQRSMEQMQRSMNQMQHAMEDMKLENRRFVNIGSEMDQEIEGRHPLDEL